MADFIKVNMEFKALSPIFSSGESLESQEQTVIGTKKYTPVRITADGHVLVPLKGRLRMAVEQILKSAGEQVCDLDKDIRGCGKCKVCDAFGSMQRRGRWLVGNLISKDFAEDITGVYTHLKTKRSTMTMDPKKVFNLQEVEAGSIFYAEVIITAPKPDDEKLLRAGAGLLKYMGVGGMVTKGYGRIGLTDYSVEEYNYSDFLK